MTSTVARRSEPSRAKILAAARDAFAREGFDRASTKAIAASAGVNSSLVFRHFGSKAGLYDAAVLHPLRSFVEGFVQTWSRYERDPHDATGTATEFMGGLYDLFREHPGLAMALIGSRSYGKDTRHGADRVMEMMALLLDRVEVVVDTEAGRRGWIGFDTRMAIRMCFGVAFSMGALDEWMFPVDGDRPHRDVVVKNMVSFVLRSVENPTPPTP